MGNFMSKDSWHSPVWGAYRCLYSNFLVEHFDIIGILCTSQRQKYADYYTFIASMKGIQKLPGNNIAAIEYRLPEDFSASDRVKVA
jgi:hypothetical protein